MIAAQPGKIESKNFCNINWLEVQRFGSTVPANSNITKNQSNRELWKLRGLYCPTNWIFAWYPPVENVRFFLEFKVLSGQLLHHTPKSKKQLSSLKTRLSDLVYACGTSVDLSNFTVIAN